MQKPINLQNAIVHHLDISSTALTSAGIEESLGTVAWKHLMRIFRTHRMIANSLSELVSHFEKPVYKGK